VQAPPFLPLLPSEAGGGIRGMALPGSGQGGSAPACGFEHPENSEKILSV